MSWQRILESARKNGFPVIVTDIAGREPMVIMPFDAFEELNEAHQVSLETWEDEAEDYEYSSLDDEQPEAGFTTSAEQTKVTPMKEEPPSKSVESPSLEEIPGSSQEVSHLSMEDRFYLEPVDDQS